MGEPVERSDETIGPYLDSLEDELTMNRFADLARRLSLLIYAVACWLAAGAMAMAQGPGQQPAEEAPPYVVSYALVILLIGLALAVVLNSSKRRDRAKPEVYGEPK